MDTKPPLWLLLPLLCLKNPYSADKNKGSLHTFQGECGQPLSTPSSFLLQYYNHLSPFLIAPLVWKRPKAGNSSDPGPTQQSRNGVCPFRICGVTVECLLIWTRKVEAKPVVYWSDMPTLCISGPLLPPTPQLTAPDPASSPPSMLLLLISPVTGTTNSPWHISSFSQLNLSAESYTVHPLVSLRHSPVQPLPGFPPTPLATTLSGSPLLAWASLPFWPMLVSLQAWP